MKHDRISKAIFPVAGLGTRFLPATKATPKEMLPIVDKPLIQYAVEEAVAAGITELIFVTSGSKGAIENHFDMNYELEAILRKSNNNELLDIVQQIVPKGVSCVYVRQPEPLGLGDAVLRAKALINKNEVFAVLLADVLISKNKLYCLEQMVAAYQKIHASMIAVQAVPLADVHKYGIVEGFEKNTDTKKGMRQEYQKIKNIIEKPLSSVAPSNNAVMGRYILPYSLFAHLEAIASKQNHEVQLTDAIAQLLAEEDVYAFTCTGDCYDCGSKIGYLKATVIYAMNHPELKNEFIRFLKEDCHLDRLNLKN